MEKNFTVTGAKSLCAQFCTKMGKMFFFLKKNQNGFKAFFY